MISQLLTLSRKHTVEFKPVDLCGIIRNVENIARNSFDKSVEILIGQMPEQAIARMDPAQIEQVVLNLAVNGAHAMTFMRGPHDKPGGALRICLEKTDSTDAFLNKNPASTAGHSYWMLSVQDDGVGMTADVREKIFDPFFTTKDKGRGTGLGLAMVYNIVRQHGGFINVYSEPGTGSVFRMYLPVAEGEAPSDTAQEMKILHRGRGHILIVDDEQVIRDLARRILEECGYTVATASNGDEAVSEFTVHPGFDLVLLDIGHARKSGIDTYMELKAIRDDVQVLLSSGFRADERVTLAMERGVAGFIQKPYTMDALAAEVSRILGRINQL
jgi:CheY-like chemotaxis protein